MGKYIKEFNNHTEYEEFVDLVDFDLQTPNVSLCNKLNEVHYSPYEKHDYSQDYLTFEIVKDGTLVWKLTGWGTGAFTQPIYYSINNGETWTTLTASSRDATISVTSGQKILIKGSLSIYYGQYSYTTGGKTYYVDYHAKFAGTALFNVYGNLKTLINNASNLNYERLLYGIFSGSNVINAENLILPYTTLTEACYKEMFYNCKLLKKAPKLLAATLTLDCYNNMFNNCTSLKKVICLATDVSAQDCTSNWLYNVPSIGTFVKAASMEDWTTGTNGIPENWTVINSSS